MFLGESDQESRVAEQLRLPDSSDVEIAVVVPVFRHSVFVADAVDSALAQETQHAFRVVIVDDGCPHDETRRIATVLATAYPDQVDYIRRVNGGLGAARNTGIDYALRRWPSVRALYFLDADNMIEPKALDRAFDTLMSEPSIGWAYPDIAMFGSVNTYWDYQSPYSILRHLKCNVSEAGSMVRREVFDSGCRFDETMRLGYEDWEFWWQCIEAGFVGRHVPFFGLRYRKRPESMLSQTEREHESVILYMRRKHKALFRAKKLLGFEAAEAPRYAILLDGGSVKQCTDVRDRGKSIRASELVDRVVAARRQPSLHVAPRYLVAASEASLGLLGRARLDRFALWWLEQQFFASADIHVAAIHIVSEPSFTEVAIRPMAPGFWPLGGDGIHLMMLRPDILNNCLDDPHDLWIRSLLSENPRPAAAVLHIELPAKPFPEAQCSDVVYWWFDLFRQLRTAFRRLPPALPPAKPRTMPERAADGQVPSELLSCGPLLPLPADDKHDIAFVIPIVAFGGVEKVAFHVAEQFHRNGWRCHLLVLSAQATISEPWLSMFDSIAFYEEKTFYQLSGPQQYLGTNYPAWLTDGDGRSLEGLLLAMDAVVNFHSSVLHKVIHKLRQFGVVTATSLHVNDMSPFGGEVGHPFLALGHEYVYDIFAPCSQTLLEWCHAMGVPRDKLVLVPNAPAHDIGSNEIADLLARRPSRHESRRELNVLFLGRLDRQKGLDRVAAIVSRGRSLNLPIAWRIVGSTIVEGAEAALARELEDLIETRGPRCGGAHGTLRMGRCPSPAFPLGRIAVDHHGGGAPRRRAGGLPRRCHRGDRGTRENRLAYR